MYAANAYKITYLIYEHFLFVGIFSEIQHFRFIITVFHSAQFGPIAHIYEIFIFPVAGMCGI